MPTNCSGDGIRGGWKPDLTQRPPAPRNGHGLVAIKYRRPQMSCVYFEAGGCRVASGRLEQGVSAFADAGLTGDCDPGQVAEISHL